MGLYWDIALANMAVIAVLGVILATTILRRLRKQYVDIDLIVLFASSVLALGFASWIAPYGF